MSLPLEQFVKQLEDSGILAGDTLKDFLPPKAAPKDAEELARELVRQKKLTKLQAELIWQGKGKSLVLGNYVLLEKIGAGGMGQVFKARHSRMDRLVAVKLLPAAMTKDKAAIARFNREVKAAAKLRHSNIIAADDADQANGVHFLVMELVDGNDLSALVKKNGPFPVAQGVNYILQAARGLEYAHAEGVVHRDIKPANLLLDKKGTVKILDMGLARIHGDVGQAELTATGAVMGTIDYMAPEQAMSTKTADARADIYSLGCSLHYLLTGKATYEGETLMAKLIAHRDHPIPDLRAICPEVPETVDAVFRKMVAKKVEDRYQTMTAVIADLERCSSGQTVNPPSFAASDTGLTDFLKEVETSQKSVVQKKTPVRTPKRDRRDIFLNKRKLLIGGGVVGVVILLAGLVISLRTNDGTLIVKVNEPDAEIQVLNEEGKVEITRQGDKGPITISVDPGKHRLKVEKNGFEVFAKEFEIAKGGEKSIMAKLVPVEEKPAVAANGWHGWPADAPKPAIAPFDAAQAKKHQEAWAAYLKVPVEYTNSIGVKFVLIPPGEFMMGSTPAEIETALKSIGPVEGNEQLFTRSEAPKHKVILTQPIYLGVNEVTQAEYEQVIGTNPSYCAAMGQGKDRVAGMETASHPVEMVSWNDAAEFCATLSKQAQLKPFYFRAGETVTPLDGTGYRLPTEAQWEFACRAGTTTKYWIGDKDEDLTSAGWFGANSGQRTHAAGELKANPFGLYDIHGNIWEWVEDWWGPNYYGEFQEQPAINPGGPSSAGSRVVRGGCWGPDASHCRSSHREESGPGRSVGFRVSLAVDAVKAALKQKASTAANSQPIEVLGIIDPARHQHSGEWKKENGVLISPIGQFGSLELPIQPGDSYRIEMLAQRTRGKDELSLGFSVDGRDARVIWEGYLLRYSGLEWLDGLRVDNPKNPARMNVPIFHAAGPTRIVVEVGRSSVRVTCDEKRIVDWEGQATALAPPEPPPLNPLTGKLWLGTFKSEFRISKLTYTPLGSVKPVATYNDPAFQQWMKDVQALPAEQQVQAVIKKLQELNPGFDGKVTGIFGQPVPEIDKGVVTTLEFRTENVRDISPVRALAGLRKLACPALSGIGKIDDLSPLTGMKLSTLIVPQNQIHDLTPLTGMPLEFLWFFSNPVKDLSPLRNMPLTQLHLAVTEVADISPLEGMKLDTLYLVKTKVKDISTLKGMPLRTLNLEGTQVTDSGRTPQESQLRLQTRTRHRNSSLHQDTGDNQQQTGSRVLEGSRAGEEGDEALSGYPSPGLLIDLHRWCRHPVC